MTDPYKDDQAIQTLYLSLKPKIGKMVREGFENWKGEIRSLGYIINVTITMKKRPDDN